MKVRHLLLGLGLLATTYIAQAQVTFTINASPTENALGYVTTETYNFVFTLNTEANTGNGEFQPGTATADDNYYWHQEWTIDPELWTSVTGDGLAGTWLEPNSGDLNPNDPAPYSYLKAAVGSPSLTLYGGADSTYNVGLTADGHDVHWIQFQGDFTGLDFTPITGTLPDVNAYFGAFTDTYAANSSLFGWIHTLNGEGMSFDGGDAFFTINSLTISTTAVPEPSTYAAIAGAVGLSLAIWRRKSARVTN